MQQTYPPARFYPVSGTVGYFQKWKIGAHW